MNIQDIQTPADLLEANTKKDPLQEAMELMTTIGYDGSKHMVTWLLSNMLDWHKQVAVEALEGENDQSPLAWAHDAGAIEIALKIIANLDADD